MKRLITALFKLTGFWMILDLVIQLLIGWADQLTEGPTGRVACGIDYSASISTLRWNRVIIP
jgi:hypothetical protein